MYGWLEYFSIYICILKKFRLSLWRPLKVDFHCFITTKSRIFVSSPWCEPRIGFTYQLKLVEQIQIWVTNILWRATCFSTSIYTHAPRSIRGSLLSDHLQWAWRSKICDLQVWPYTLPSWLHAVLRKNFVQVKTV